MSRILTRRDLLEAMLTTAAALRVGGVPAVALAQGEVVVPFTDLAPPATPAPGAPPAPLRFNPSDLTSFVVSNDLFFAVSHYGVPQVDVSTYLLRITGLVERPMQLSLADLKRRRRVEFAVGFECSGNNNARGNPLVGNARWAGVSLSALLKEAGLKPSGREVVFFSADKGTEEVTHGRGNAKVEQHFARGMDTESAMRPDVLLAYEMNGEPLPVKNGAPLRLVAPGWYGVANVKWLDHIHVQDTRFVGRFMGRDYVTLKSEVVGGETIWMETWVSRMRLKSMVARLTRNGSLLKAVGFALSDGTPIKAVEVRVDGGAWREATMWKENTPQSWKLFTYEWNGATSGDHTIVSRAIDARGEIQPEQDHPTKRSQWENNGQFVRKFSIA
jgi:DMSO/TMAO reductase YedYZ molybdopterin-dependent catalytic subunit